MPIHFPVGFQTVFQEVVRLKACADEEVAWSNLTLSALYLSTGTFRRPSTKRRIYACDAFGSADQEALNNWVGTGGIPSMKLAAIHSVRVEAVYFTSNLSLHWKHLMFYGAVYWRWCKHLWWPRLDMLVTCIDTIYVYAGMDIVRTW